MKFLIDILIYHRNLHYVSCLECSTLTFPLFINYFLWILSCFDRRSWLEALKLYYSAGMIGTLPSWKAIQMIINSYIILVFYSRW